MVGSVCSCIASTYPPMGEAEGAPLAAITHGLVEAPDMLLSVLRTRLPPTGE
jgi:hypothetical protein